MTVLIPKEVERYDRQMRILAFGSKGQEKLKSAKVVVAGIGGLGCPASIYLAAAGVGKLVLIDKERVELNNLNRQILHCDSDIGRLKIDSAVEKLRQLNPNIKIDGINVEIREDNVDDLIKGAHVVVDGMDNYKTRFILNKACVNFRIPFIHAAIQGIIGQLMTIIPYVGPCLRCFLATEPPEVQPFAALGATAGIMACLEATEAVKLIVGLGKPAIGRLLIFDGENMTFDEVLIARQAGCQVCAS